MSRRGAVWGLAIVALNLALASAAAFVAPSDIGTTTDRLGYEYVGAHPLAPNCAHNIFCYRVLVPVALEQVPLPPAVRWRAFAVTANAITGMLLAILTDNAGAGGVPVGAKLPRRLPLLLIASILFQTSFGATFAIFDPFTPDPVVFLAAALIVLAWLRNWAVLAFLVALVGVFAKETVALILSATAIAAWFAGRRGAADAGNVLLFGDVVLPRGTPAARPWILGASVIWLVVLGFHLGMDRLAGWSEAGSGSADLAAGGWLVRWLADSTLSPSARLLYLFIPFAFAWLFAILAFPKAPARLRYLAVGALIVVPPLVYVQTAERALGSAFFVVVPLAAIFLARLPPALGIAAAVTNGLVTARVGLSTAWLPPLPYLIALAAIVGAVAIWRWWTDARSLPKTALSSSRVASSR